MNLFDGNPKQFWGFLEEHFSTPRMNSYLDHARGEHSVALDLYSWNSRASLKLWELVAITEVALRNRLSDALDEFSKRQNYRSSWVFDEQGILGRGRKKPNTYSGIEKVEKRLVRINKEITPNNIIAGLSLEFWVSLVSKQHLDIWPDLASAFPNSPQRTQINIQEPIKDLLNLRNRIAHHDRIWNLNLDYYSESISNLIAFMSWDLYEFSLPLIAKVKNYYFGEDQ